MTKHLSQRVNVRKKVVELLKFLAQVDYTLLLVGVGGGAWPGGKRDGLGHPSVNHGHPMNPVPTP